MQATQEPTKLRTLVPVPVAPRCQCGSPSVYALLTEVGTRGRHLGTGTNRRNRTYRCRPCAEDEAARCDLALPQSTA